MSRTRKGGKGPGYDFWSRRSSVGHYGKFSKKVTRKQERARDKQIEHAALVNPEEFEGRFPGE